MADRKTTAHELAKRAKDVGWRVSKPRSLSGAYMVHMTPCNNELCNHQLQIHLTSSDVNAERSIMRAMNAHGLPGLEAKVAAEKEKERQAKLAADKAAADRKTKVLAQQSSLTQKAAGPYMLQPEEVEYEWFATPHPAPWMRICWITPTLAEKILANLNTDNRALDDGARREFWKNVVLSQQLRRTHQGVAFDRRGILQDGQHRFQAIADAGKDDPFVKVAMAVWVGEDPDNFKAIDEGKLRTAAQLFAKGDESYGAVLQSMMRVVIAYRAPDGNVRKAIRIRRSNAEILDTFQNDADLLRDCASFAARNTKKIKCPPSPLAAAMYLIRKANGADNKLVKLFFDGLINGTYAGTRSLYEPDDPRTVLRENFDAAAKSRKRRPGIEVAGLTIMSWNNIVVERSPRTIKIDPDATLPRPLICADDGVVPRKMLREMKELREMETA